MAPRQAIDLALDLARMPALARSAVAPPIPADVIDVMQIAAADPPACQAAADKTGERPPVLVDAARFYLQQVLFRPEADSYRILGLTPAASRETARRHMRWLLQWLHPDRNCNVDAVYAERVVKAWREISGADASAPRVGTRRAQEAARYRSGSAGRLARVRYSRKPRPLSRATRMSVIWGVPAGLALILLGLWSAYTFAPEQMSAMTLLR